MNENSLYDRLCELSWRGALTGAEEAELRAWLAAHPEAQSDWEAESGLNEALARLPDAPVPSNFTARVMQAFEREADAARRAPTLWWQSWQAGLSWLPKAAVAAVVLGAGLFAYHHHLQTTRRTEMARSVVVVADVFSLPSPEILKDFDVIRALPPGPPADEELINVLLK